MASAEPVFDLEAGDSHKLTLVVRYDDALRREGMGGDQHVVPANGKADAFELSPKLRVGGVSQRVERLDVDLGQDALELDRQAL